MRHLELCLLMYLPFAATVCLAGIATYLARTRGEQEIGNMIGPWILISAGWTFLGMMVAAARHGSFPILDGEKPGLDRLWRRALLCLPIIIGLALLTLGIYLLFR